MSNSNWCITRNMSWTAVNYICKHYQISFEELPVAGENFWAELDKVRRDKPNQNTKGK